MRQDELWDQLYSSQPRAWRGNARIPDPLEGKGDALDVGCGNGKTSSKLIDLGYHTKGVDFSAKAVESCRELLGENASFEVSSATDLPFPDGSFDYITAVHVLEHLTDEELSTAVSEFTRILRPGGYVFTRTFTDGDLRSVKRSTGDIRYIYRDVETMVGFFDSFERVSAELVEETTKFGATRSRVECLFKKVLEKA